MSLSSSFVGFWRSCFLGQESWEFRSFQLWVFLIKSFLPSYLFYSCSFTLRTTGSEADLIANCCRSCVFSPGCPVRALTSMSTGGCLILQLSCLGSWNGRKGSLQSEKGSVGLAWWLSLWDDEEWTDSSGEKKCMAREWGQKEAQLPSSAATSRDGHKWSLYHSLSLNNCSVLCTTSLCA